MIADQISLALADLKKLAFQLKEIKREIKTESKLDSDEYLSLKSAYKDLRQQIKDVEEEWERGLLADEAYLELKKMQEAKEEEIAKANGKLFELVAKLPQKPFEMDMDTEDGHVLVQIHPEMRVYLNGKEEKRR